MFVVHGIPRDPEPPHWEFVRKTGNEGIDFAYDHDRGRILCCGCAEKELKDAILLDSELGFKDEEPDDPEDTSLVCCTCGHEIWRDLIKL